MQKLTIWMIVSNWLIGVFVPIVYRIVYGSFPENLQSIGEVPDSFMIDASVIITVVYFLSIVLIHMIPNRQREIMETVEVNKNYYYITIAIFIFLSYRAGILDYHSVITGGASGALRSYYSMLFDPTVLYVVYLFCVKERGSILVLSGSYLLITLLSRSRSGAMHLGRYLIGFLLLINDGSILTLKRKATESAKRYKKQIGLLIIVLAIASPAIFISSTKARGSVAANSNHKAIETIAARCSCLDEAGIALYVSGSNTKQMEVFRQKYSIFHQLGCIIDSTVPGTLFIGDVDPNQYFRAMVGYMTVEDAAKYYTSTNMTFPIYMVLKYGIILGTTFSIIIIIAFYTIVSTIRNPIWRVALIMIVFDEMLIYFDWVMVWRSFLRVVLTVLTFKVLATDRLIRFHGFSISGHRIRIPKNNFGI